MDAPTPVVSSNPMEWLNPWKGQKPAWCAFAVVTNYTGKSGQEET